MRLENEIDNVWLAEVIEDCLKYCKYNNLKNLEKALEEAHTIALSDCATRAPKTLPN
jgi:hypothetical protein